MDDGDLSHYHRAHVETSLYDPTPKEQKRADSLDYVYSKWGP